MTENRIRRQTESTVSDTEKMKNGNKVNKTKSYVLNKSKSMEKKLRATETDDFSVIYTGGGVKFEFNAGSYELLKLATAKYFAKEQNGVKYQEFIAEDQQGNQVERRYKATRGKQALYTLNLYHTKCSCLVNGRHTSYFMETDLNEILNIIEESVKGSSLEEVNRTIKEIILQYYSSVRKDDDTCSCTSTENNNDITPTDIITTSCHSIDCQVDEGQDKIYRTVSVQTNCPEIPFQERNMLDITTSVYSLLSTIQKELSGVKSALMQHIADTKIHFSRIEDEITSVKKRCTLNGQVTEKQIETVQDSTSSIQMVVQKEVDNAQKRFHSIIESLRTLHEKNRKENSDTTYSSTMHETSQTNYEPVQTYISPVQTDVQMNTTHDMCQPRVNTLLIGSSILKGIRTRGLKQTVNVSTNRGAQARDILGVLKQTNLNKYNNIVVYAGGNDVSNGRTLNEITNDLTEIIQICKEQSCEVYVCTLCPRKDTDIVPLNDHIQQISNIHGAKTIDIYTAYVYGNGSPAVHYFQRDGIHLNNNGTRTLVRCLDKTVPIVRRNDVPQGSGNDSVRRNTMAIRTNHSWRRHNEFASYEDSRQPRESLYGGYRQQRSYTYDSYDSRRRSSKNSWRFRDTNQQRQNNHY